PHPGRSSSDHGTTEAVYRSGVHGVGRPGSVLSDGDNDDTLQNISQCSTLGNPVSGARTSVGNVRCGRSNYGAFCRKCPEISKRKQFAIQIKGDNGNPVIPSPGISSS